MLDEKYSQAIPLGPYPTHPLQLAPYYADTHMAGFTQSKISPKVAWELPCFSQTSLITKFEAPAGKHHY